MVVETPNSPKCAIPSDTKIGMTPTGFERFCLWLKKGSLKTYVKYRLAGHTKINAIIKITSTIKDTELFDHKNLYKGRQYITDISMSTDQ